MIKSVYFVVILLISSISVAYCGESYVGAHLSALHQINTIKKNVIFWNINNPNYRLNNQVIGKNKLFFSPLGVLNFRYRNDFHRKKIVFGISTEIGYYISSKHIEWNGMGTNSFGQNKSFEAKYKSIEHGFAVPIMLNATWLNVNISMGLLFKGTFSNRNHFSYSVGKNAPYEIVDHGDFANAKSFTKYFAISIPFTVGYIFKINTINRIHIALEYYLGVFDGDGLSVGIVPLRQGIRNDYIGLGINYEYHLKCKKK
jgi:hypothetical protein